MLLLVVRKIDVSMTAEYLISVNLWHYQQQHCAAPHMARHHVRHHGNKGFVSQVMPQQDMTWRTAKCSRAVGCFLDPSQQQKQRRTPLCKTLHGTKWGCCCVMLVSCQMVVEFSVDMGQQTLTCTLVQSNSTGGSAVYISGLTLVSQARMICRTASGVTLDRSRCRSADPCVHGFGNQSEH